jgi:hypothetical protein
MADKPTSGTLFGVPYNFEQPSLKRLLSAYWQPGEGMLVEKPFGVGYTLNLANWRSWVVLGVTALLWWTSSDEVGDADDDEDAEPVEVVVDSD